MKRWFFTSASVLVLCLAGCGDSAQSPVAPQEPAFDSGLFVGGNSTMSTASDTTDNASRGGGLFVGGN